MKKIIYIVLGISFAFTSCSEVLDQEPLGLISDASVWQDENLVDTKLNELYKNSLFLNQGGQAGFNAGLDGNMAGEFRNIGPWQTPNGNSTGIIDETGAPAGSVQYWAYGSLRRTNEFIQNMEILSELDAEFKILWEQFRSSTYDKVIKPVMSDLKRILKGLICLDNMSFARVSLILPLC